MQTTNIPSKTKKVRENYYFPGMKTHARFKLYLEYRNYFIDFLQLKPIYYSCCMKVLEGRLVRLTTSGKRLTIRHN